SFHRKLRVLAVEHLVPKAAGDRIARGEALEAVTLVLRKPIGEQAAIDLEARLVQREILLPRSPAVAALIVGIDPETVLPVDARSLHRKRERGANIVAVARRLKRPDLAPSTPPIEQSRRTNLLLLAGCFSDGKFSLLLSKGAVDH